MSASSSNQESKSKNGPLAKEGGEVSMEASNITAAEAIEEDDEFEEFIPCHWDAKNEDPEDATQWQDNWDDDDIEDDFTKNLRAELTAVSASSISK